MLKIAELLILVLRYALAWTQALSSVAAFTRPVCPHFTETPVFLVELAIATLLRAITMSEGSCC